MAFPQMQAAPPVQGSLARQRLVAAALNLFGQKGYDGASAREIAAAASTALAAIPYYFETKQALYIATLEEVRTQFAAAVAPAAMIAGAALVGTPAEATRALSVFKAALLTVIAVDMAAESWTKLLIREHLDPGIGFDLVYEDAARDAIELIAALIARATGRNAGDDAVVLEAFSAMGEVLIFRVTRHAVVRRLGWAELGEPEAAQICTAMRWTPC